MGEELHAVKCSTMRCGAGPLACAGTPGRLAAPRVTIHVSYREGLSHEFPGVFHPNLANVAIQCSPGFAYESYMGGNCGGPGNAQQNFNAALDMGWTIAPVPSGDGAGLTNPGTIFEPPPLTGLPFSEAVFLQGIHFRIRTDGLPALCLAGCIR